MTISDHIYSFKYNHHYSELCKLESKQIFDVEQKHNHLFSNIKVDPSISPFIKSRFDVILSSEDYPDLLSKVKKENIHIEGFKAEYLVLEGDSTAYRERLRQLKDIGFSIEGDPDYYSPTIIYSICYYKNIWYFGILVKHNPDWQRHKQKPYSFSSSISINIAKSLVSIASKGNKTKQLLNACCGFGTVMLEACYSGFPIEGCDINWKACKNTRKNLAHYDYSAKVYRSDVKDLDKKYDAAILDLPYNLYTHSNELSILNIIKSVSKLAARIVIVSISDIGGLIKKSGLEISGFCHVEKRGNSKFRRSIWVCEKGFLSIEK